MNTDKAYQQALDYIYSYVDYSLKRQDELSAEKFDLERMRTLMAALGNPERAYPLIHIAGTKGKGSVASFCAAALQAAGYKVGLYTSPHLQDFAERMQINGKPIDRADVVKLVEEIKPQIESVPYVTTFEITTALAFIHFARQKVTSAVIEVGLGGRLDATNVCQPDVTVITSLSYEHTYVLGETLAEIAGEKAGIIKPGIPVVLAPQKEEARSVVEAVAAERGALLVQVGRDYCFSSLTRSLDGQTLMVWSADGPSEIERVDGAGGEAGTEPLHLDIPLLGNHQVENAAVAYAALQVANNHGIPVSDAAIQKGFRDVVWPARFELLQRDPAVIVDSAHTKDSASKLRLTLDEYFPEGEIILVFGVSEDKDTAGMLTELAPRVSQVIATRSIHPRAMEPEKIAEIAAGLGLSAIVQGTVEEALDTALLLSNGKKVVLATGSIFSAAGVRQAWFNRNNVPITV
jgi:dihydrofolate synthase/folylpolyglutamate synthase